MSGKAKQSQRTKNNVRPSSSGRSAELLAGTDSLSRPLPLFPTLAGTQLKEQLLNADFSLCIKKLNKKDPITKIKALQELTELVKTGNEEDIKVLLPHWTRLYQTLSNDCDHKVREATQSAHGAVCGRAGRELAPHLRRLVPGWLAAQADPYAPAAAAARAALASTFPENKLPEVINFCKTEIMTMIMDTLTEKSVVSAPKKGEDADAAAERGRRERAVCGALRVLCCACSAMADGAERGSWLSERLSALLDVASFWKLAADPALNVKALWVCALGQVWALAGPAARARHAAAAGRALAAVAGAAHGKRSPLLVRALADCISSFSDTSFGGDAQDWDESIKNKDELCKKIFVLIENGGWGDARAALALAQALPARPLAACRDALYRALLAGLETKTVVCSKSECEAWSKGIAECLARGATQDAAAALSAHREWLRAALGPRLDVRARGYVVPFAAAAMPQLLQHWTRLTPDASDRLVRGFWHNVGSTVLSRVETLAAEPGEVADCVQTHVTFLCGLETPLSHRTVRKRKVRFETEPDTEVNESEAESPVLDDGSIERYRRDLHVLVETVCSRYFEFAETNEIAAPVFGPLIPLLKRFDQTELFAAIAKRRGEGAPLTLSEWFKNTVMRWLAGERLRCPQLAEVALLVVTHLDRAERADALAALGALPDVAEWCLRAAAALPAAGRAPLADWLRGAACSAVLLAVCRRFVQDDGDDPTHLREKENLLLLCVARRDDQGPSVSDEAVSGVLREVTSALTAASRVRHVAALAVQLTRSAAAHAPWSGALDALLVAMFRLTLHAPTDGGPLPADEWRRVRDAWCAALAAAPPHTRRAIGSDALRVVREYIFDEYYSLDTSRIERAACLCSLLVDNEALSLTTDALSECAAQPRAVEAVEACALRSDTLAGRLCCPLAECEAARRVPLDGAEPGRRALVAYAHRLLLRTELVRVRAAAACALLEDDAVRSFFLHTLKDYLVLDSLYGGYGFWPDFDIIEECHGIVTKAIDEIMQRNDSVKRKVHAEAAAAGAARGYYWARASRYLGTRFGLAPPAPPAPQPLPLELHTSGFFHDIQVGCEDSADPWERYRARWACAARSWAAAHGARPGVRACVAAALPRLRDASIDLFVDSYYAHADTMLYDRRLCDVPWTEAAAAADVLDALGALVAARGADMPAHHWDFVNISLCSLVHSARLSAEAPRPLSAAAALVARPALDLVTRVVDFVEGVPALATTRQLPDHVVALPTEWRDVFAPDLHANVLSLAVALLESGVRASDAGRGERAVRAGDAACVLATTRAVRRLRWALLSAARRAQDLSPERLAAACGAALAAPAHPLYLRLAHSLLRFIADPLFDDDVEKLKVWSSNENADDVIERPKFSLHYFEESLRRVQDLADAALDTVTAGEETCEPAPASGAYRTLLAHLLLAERMLGGAALAAHADRHPDLLEHYAAFFRGNDYIEKLLLVCLRLVPARLVAAGGADAPPPEYAPLFTEHVDFDCTERGLRPGAARAALVAMACRCLYLGAGGSGAAAAAARGWWGAASARLHRLLQRLVGAYVTPALVRAQLAQVTARAARLPDADVAVHLSTRELECRIAVDERPVVLTLQLSDHHPLGAPRVHIEGPPEPGPLSLAVLLTAQNGSAWRALRLWRARLVRQVDSAPVCYVCYMRLHPDSGRLPRQRCAQCRNKFHHECLQKWFTTSKKMECPLCRAVYKT